MEDADRFVAYEGVLVPPAWVTAMQMVTQSTNTDALIVIRGERGTGKERLARLVHAASGRGSEPFVKIDCAARPTEVLAGRLFGHGRDVGTGRRRLGAIELAHRGTLFLDNIDALPSWLHPDVLRLLQTHTCERVRPGTPPPLDVRIVLATSEPLASRDDRLPLSGGSPVLKVIDLQLAPLRARRDHIGPLAEFFLAHFNARYDRSARLSGEEMLRLADYSWPGNIRELEAEIRRFVLAPEPRRISPHVADEGGPASLGRLTA